MGSFQILIVNRDEAVDKSAVPKCVSLRYCGDLMFTKEYEISSTSSYTPCVYGNKENCRTFWDTSRYSKNIRV